jgi:alpha-ketoglutarate-dependent taurine dioxygenase
MARIKPMALIESMSKKVCMHSDVYFRTNSQTGVTYTGKLCNPSTKEPTENQTKAKTRFAKVAAAVRTILAGTSEQVAKLKAEYKAQTKIGSLFGYAMHKLNGNYDANGDLISD